ncbi:hypothetical protein AAHB37_01495 [Glutamicibacter halophytocola]|uniref:hypothetical protein n=1 Tax=Glutamicibacter halophytocola TaxID=1933880 RepID=UPI00321BA503
MLLRYFSHPAIESQVAPASYPDRNRITGGNRRLRAEDCIVADKKALRQAQCGARLLGSFPVVPPRSP